MADAPENPTPPAESEPTRDGETGRYVRKHAAGDKPDTAAGGDSGSSTPPPPPQEPSDKDKEKDGRKRWLLLLLLLLILALLLCAGAAYYLWWGRKTNDPDATAPVATPTAVTTPAAGTTAPASPTVSPTTAGPTPSSSVSPGTSPATKTINMPKVVGLPAQDAKTILEGAGFTNITFVPEANANEKLNLLVSYTVTKQSVAEGTQVPADTALVITCKTSSNGMG